MSLITLTTDFGTRDWFVGTMKGVIHGINPRVRLVDLTHEIPPGDIRGGAFSLSASCGFFPDGTIHVVVVDPGVGGSRKAVAVKTRRGCFIGPDNGVLSWALRDKQVLAIHELTNRAYFLNPVSSTFHGRDVFAPVAAQLSRGVPVANFGPAAKDIIQLPWPEPIKVRKELRGEVLYVDHFGNAITNVTPSALSDLGSGKALTVWRESKRLCRLAGYYGAVPAGHATAVIGSSGLLEIAINGGNAARELRLTVGTRIQVRIGRLR